MKRIFIKRLVMRLTGCLQLPFGFRALAMWPQIASAKVPKHFSFCCLFDLYCNLLSLCWHTHQKYFWNCSCVNICSKILMSRIKVFALLLKKKEIKSVWKALKIVKWLANLHVIKYWLIVSKSKPNFFFHVIKNFQNYNCDVQNTRICVKYIHLFLNSMDWSTFFVVWGSSIN